MKTEDFKLIINGIPDTPGVYRFIDSSNIPIYVGKAKNLRKRVSSYFNKNHIYKKTEVMVKYASRIEFTVVDTEHDALLLENSLIKKYQPRYNVSLKDDKTYPYICIKKERFPRVFLTRQFIRDGSEYFGPYTSIYIVQGILDFIKTIIPLRNCILNLDEINISKQKYKVCLEYHIGNCKGPCESHQSQEDYDFSIDQIRHILKGNIQPVIQFLKQKMNLAVESYNYEEAEKYRQRLDGIQLYKSKSTIVNAKLNNIDVFAYYEDEDNSYVNYMKISNGTIIQTKTLEVVKKIDEEKEELLSFIISDIRSEINSNSDEILVPFEIDFIQNDVKLTVPKIGDKLKLVELGYKNLLYYKKAKQANKEQFKKVPSWIRVLSTLQSDFKLKELPINIECFDNSNFQGSFPVASMVSFKNGTASKKDYRHFNIKTVEGPNDFASMKEIVFRRYRRLIDEDKELPQLIIVDGGKGQLSSAVDSLKELGLNGKVTIVGIAKRLEEIYFPEDSVPLYVNKKSESLKLIQQIRDEAHRFAITFHRNQRQKGTIKSSLTSIDGIGQVTFEKLMKEFHSIKKLQSASQEEIIKVFFVLSLSLSLYFPKLPHKNVFIDL